MSFDVTLIASTASPTGAEARAATDRALTLCGARRGGTGELDIVFANGDGHEFYDPGDEAGGMFPVRRFSPELANVMFEVADATQCFILAVQESAEFLRTPGNLGDAPEGAEGFPIVPVADPDALVARLTGGFQTWADFRDHALQTPIPTANPNPDPDPTSLLGRFWNRLTKRS